MSANFKEKIYVQVEGEDLMPLFEKVQLFAQAHGWQGQVITLEQAMMAQEWNIVDYCDAMGDATAFMNEHHLPAQEESKKLIWGKNQECNGGGVVNVASKEMEIVNKQED